MVDKQTMKIPSKILRQKKRIRRVRPVWLCLHLIGAALKPALRMISTSYLACLFYFIINPQPKFALISSQTTAYFRGTIMRRRIVNFTIGHFPAIINWNYFLLSEAGEEMLQWVGKKCTAYGLVLYFPCEKIFSTFAYNRHSKGGTLNKY